MVRLAYIETHPTAYRVPLLRRVAKEPGICFKVFYRSDFSARGSFDSRWGRHVRWDSPLLEGYDYEVLPAVYSRIPIDGHRPVSLDRRLVNYGLMRRLRAGQFDALWLMGYTLWFNWAALLGAKRLGMRVFIWDEATLIKSIRTVPPFVYQRGFFRRTAKRSLIKALSRLCDGFLAIGTGNREFYEHYGVPKEKIFLMPNAIDNDALATRARALPEALELRRALGLSPERPVILFVGRMIAVKSLDTLLDAYEGLSPDGRTEPHPYLVLVGEGEQASRLRARAAGFGWKSILFVGFKTPLEILPFYKMCDVFVLPSLSETWGIVVNEAMNFGRAVVVSDRVGCAADLIHQGENGYVFAAGDAPALANALRLTLADAERCRQMGQRSAALIDKWSYRETVEGLRGALGLSRSCAG